MRVLGFCCVEFMGKKRIKVDLSQDNEEKGIEDM